MARHQQSLIDVVAGVDRCERRRHGDANAAEDFALRRRLARGADPFAIAADDHFEVAVLQRVGREEPLAIDDQSRVRVACDLFRFVVEADPCRRHGVGVDVVEEIVDGEVAHPQIELAAELFADELRIFGEEENALARSEADRVGRSHRRAEYTNEPATV